MHTPLQGREREREGEREQRKKYNLRMHVRFTEVLLGMLLSRKNKKEKKETNVMVTGGREVSLGAVLIAFVNLTSIYV